MPPPTMRRIRLMAPIWDSAARLCKGGRFVLDDRRRNDARGEDIGEGLAGDERASRDLGAMRGEGEQMGELDLADDVARPGAGLAQGGGVFEPDDTARLATMIHTSSRPCGMSSYRPACITTSSIAVAQPSDRSSKMLNSGGVWR